MKSIISNIIRFIILALARLPLAILYRLSDFVYFINHYLIRYRYAVVLDNLSRSFPSKSKEEIRSISKGFYHHLADLLAETIKNLGGEKKVLKLRMKFVNLELLNNLYEQGHSVILYSGHYGNWEWLAFLSEMVPAYKTIAFYQPLSDPVFDDLVKRSREKYGTQVIPSNQAFRALKQYHDEGVQTLSIMLGDQSPPSSGQKIWIDFLGHPTAFLHGANKIGKKLGMKLIYPHYTKSSRGFYEIEFKQIKNHEEDREEYSIIKTYAAFLEKSIRDDPTLWLWSHRRWKLQPDSDPDQI